MDYHVDAMQPLKAFIGSSIWRAEAIGQEVHIRLSVRKSIGELGALRPLVPANSE